jgi:hypothetical protein
LLRLALNCDPPDLCLLIRYDYRHEPLVPGSICYFKGKFGHLSFSDTTFKTYRHVSEYAHIFAKNSNLFSLKNYLKIDKLFDDDDYGDYTAGSVGFGI